MCRGGDKIFTKSLHAIEKTRILSRLDLANFIKSEIIKTGGVEAFPVIVTSGKRAGMIFIQFQQMLN